MARAHLMILPSLWEGLPCAVLEACAVGTPDSLRSAAIFRSESPDALVLDPPRDGLLLQAAPAARPASSGAPPSCRPSQFIPVLSAAARSGYGRWARARRQVGATMVAWI